MIKTPLYTEIVNDYPKELIHEWPFIQIDKYTRLHYKQVDTEEGEKYGFYFHSVKHTGHTLSDFKNNIHYSDIPFENSTTTVESLLWGIAYFDGVRHLYFGTQESKNDGYFYYPDFDIISKINIELVKLEQLYCQDPDKRELNEK